MDPGQLLVGTDRWRVGTLALEPDGAVLLSVVPAAARARCPACGTPSARRHSWYRRTALDLPWRGHAVRLCLWARRFFCDAPTCPRTVFAERFPGLLARYARRTEAATELLLAMARCAGGEAGARLARAAGVPVSPDTLRRLLRAFAPIGAPTPSVLGVDEFALGKPERYGLVLVDLASRRPVDVLPDQEASTLAGWLRRHPGVGVVARDRGQHVREGVRLGAPNAVQIADRFHLLRNVVDALDDVQRGRPHPGRAAGRGAVPAAPAADPGGPPPWEIPPAAATERQPSPRAGPLQWERVRDLRAAGQSVRAVGQALGLTPRTVRRLLRRPAPSPQEYVQHRRVPRPLEPFVPYLQQRWLEGCRNGRVLTEELRERGYRGAGTGVRSLIARWRPPKPPPPPPRPPRPPVRWPLLLDPAALKEEERADLRVALEADTVLARAYDLVQQFRAALHARDPAGFEAWLQAAAASELAPFTRLAAGLLGDADAVRNAFLYPWSTGPVEGHITRIKLLKRQGYGRAKTPLLRARVLGAN